MSIPHSSGFPSVEGIYITVRSALEEWKAARTLLADTIQSYLAACATLHTICTAPSHQFVARSVIEEALVTVNSELGSLASHESTLYDMRASLATMGNQSPTLASINSLPPEILARVFALSKIYCVRKQNNERFSHGFTGVCAYWRQVALNSTDLWTHVDVGPGISEELTELLLERTKAIPVQVHVYESNVVDGATSENETEKALRVLAPLVHRVHTLDIESYAKSRRFICRVLNLWLAGGNSSLSRTLVIYRPCGVVTLSSDGRGEKAIQGSSENAEMVLQSLNTLHLQDVEFDWDGGAYRGLVDLRLSSPKSDTPISISHIANILSINPKLVVLKLGHLRITPLEGQGEPAPIILNSLKVLNLTGLESYGLKLLLPLVLIPSSSVGLSVGLPADQHVRDELVAFLDRCPVSTLYYVFYRHLDVHSLQLSLLEPLPYVSTLVLHNIDIYGTLASETRPVSSPRLSSVILVSCEVTFEGLKEFISEHGIQKLRLDRCKLPHGYLLDSHAIRTSLLALYPELWCCISDTDSTSQLPCRAMFDH